MFSLLALIWIPAGYFFTWPLVDRLLGRNADATPSLLEVGLLAVAFSTGLLSLILFYVGLLPGQWITPLTTLLVIALVFGAGLLVNPGWFAPAVWKQYWKAQWYFGTRFDFDALLLWTVLGSLSIMLIHALYYPFVGDDTLTRYALQAKQIYLARNFPDHVYGYPPLEPLVFVSTWFAAEGINEHLAKLYPVIASAGMVGATFLIGRKVGGGHVGLLSAAILAVTPAFIRYGTLGYTDIPTTFPLTLAVYYSLRWWETAQPRNALLSGLLIGVALFTKQSALTWVASITVLPVARAVATRTGKGLVGNLAAFLIPIILIAGPWYIRNALLTNGREILPVAGLYHRLEPGTALIGIIPSLHWPGDFGPVLRGIYGVGWVIGLALAARQGWQVLRGHADALSSNLILAAVMIPYWLAWWSNFSFDGRFLLFIMPLMAVWSASLLQWLIDQLTQRMHLPRPVWLLTTALTLGGSLLWGASDRFGGVYYALTRPFEPDAERLRRAKGGMIDVVMYIRRNLDPAEDRILLIDSRLEYYLLDFNVDSFYPLQLADLEGYDYLVRSSFIYGIYTARLGWDESEYFRNLQNARIFSPLYVSNDVWLVKIDRVTLPTTEEVEQWRSEQQSKPDKNEESP